MRLSRRTAGIVTSPRRHTSVSGITPFLLTVTLNFSQMRAVQIEIPLSVFEYDRFPQVEIFESIANVH